MTKQKIKHYEPQTVTEAEKVLADLEGKRQKLLTFAQQLTEVRRAHAYAADDLAQSGHPGLAPQCPLSGGKADIEISGRDVCFGP